MLAAANDRTFQRLTSALDLEALAEDDRFLDNPSRVRHREELAELVRQRTRTLESAELIARLRHHSVPCSPIQDVAQVAGDPQVEASGMLRRLRHPRIEEYRDLAFPVRVDGVRPEGAKAPPDTGAHTEAVLREAGYTDAEIAELRAAGALGV